METSSNDAGLVANLSEMMNVTHAPNVVAPVSRRTDLYWWS